MIGAGYGLRLDNTATGFEKLGNNGEPCKILMFAGKVPGAVRFAKQWLIPRDAKKPVDCRTIEGRKLKGKRGSKRGKLL